MIPSLSEALTERGYETLTPVQEAVIAPELAAQDLLVSAQTGSGKTVGFGLAIAPTLLGEEERFGRAGLPLALVIAPTRELAFQVKQELSWLYARTGAVVASCVGGMDARQERRSLERGAHIVVGTPGRLRDHIERGALDLSGLQAAVLDEADEMLDLGFKEDLEFILGEAPEERRTLLFSATVPPMIVKLAQQYQRDAQRISTLSGTKQHSDIEYQAIRVAQSDSEKAIFNLLRYHHDEGAIVFANTRAQVNHLTARLANRGFATVSLSGELSQTERTHALQAMRDGRARVCVATDVAARGIDLPNLTLVIHADLPTNTESLLHRSGRTGRAGRKGISALIVAPRDVKKAERLLKWAKIKAEWTEAPTPEDIQRVDEARLLADPLWSEDVTEEQAAFAAKLLEAHEPEAIAAAYLRLYQSRQSAPEDLLPPDTKPERREPRDFGPSRWIALSVGRKDRAEPRWLLPLLLRAGNMEKSAIGAIRVQESETFVEMAEARVDAFVNGLGPDGLVEDGMTARVLDKAPDLGRPMGGGGGGKPRGGKPFEGRGKPGPRSGGPRGDRGDRGGFGDKRRDGPREDRPRREASDADAPRAQAPAAEARPAPATDKPPRRDDAPRARSGDGDAPKAKRWDGDGFKDRPKGKPAGKAPGKPGGKPSGKPMGKPAGKPAGKAFGKPGGKPSGKPAGKPAGKPKASASDTSKRFTPPGKAGKPGGGSRREGGFDVPRRGKR